jgi:hypothetical protein
LPTGRDDETPVGAAISGRQYPSAPHKRSILKMGPKTGRA